MIRIHESGALGCGVLGWPDVTILPYKIWYVTLCRFNSDGNGWMENVGMTGMLCLFMSALPGLCGKHV